MQVAALTAHPSAVLAASARDIVDAAGTPVLRNRGLGGLRGEVTGTEAVRRTVLAGTNIFGEPASGLWPWGSGVHKTSHLGFAKIQARQPESPLAPSC